jgi:phosphoglycolate phosphatase
VGLICIYQQKLLYLITSNAKNGSLLQLGDLLNLVIFDLDGTLIETAGEIGLAVNRTLEDFELAPVSDFDVRRWIGHGTGWLMKQAWSDRGRDPETDTDQWGQVMERFVHHYFDTAGTQSYPYPHVMETLGRLGEMGVKRAILTNKEGRFTDRVLAAHGLDKKLLDGVVSGDTLPVKKPNPAGIHHLLSQFNVGIENALFVGDSETDIKTARAAKLACWAVPYGYNHGRPVADENPDRVVEDVRPVLDYFSAPQIISRAQQH